MFTYINMRIFLPTPFSLPLFLSTPVGVNHLPPLTTHVILISPHLVNYYSALHMLTVKPYLHHHLRRPKQV